MIEKQIITCGSFALVDGEVFAVSTSQLMEPVFYLNRSHGSDVQAAPGRHNLPPLPHKPQVQWLRVTR
jgi:hypothetical protein